MTQNTTSLATECCKYVSWSGLLLLPYPIAPKGKGIASLQYCLQGYCRVLSLNFEILIFSCIVLIFVLYSFCRHFYY